MNTTTPRPTPETDAEVKDFDAPWLYYVNADFARKLERERDEARDQLKAMERAGAEQARRADENREWALGTERERNEVIDQLEAMRKAIKEVSLQLTFAEKVSGASVLHIYVYDALAKLKPFIKP